MPASAPMTIFSVAIAFNTGLVYRINPHYSCRFVALRQSSGSRAQSRDEISRSRGETGMQNRVNPRDT